MAIGIVAGAVPDVACTKLETSFGYDDALDTFGVMQAPTQLPDGGLRPDADDEEEGLDQHDHGDAGHHLDDGGAGTSAHAVPFADSMMTIGALGTAREPAEK